MMTEDLLCERHITRNSFPRKSLFPMGSSKGADDSSGHESDGDLGHMSPLSSHGEEGAPNQLSDYIICDDSSDVVLLDAQEQCPAVSAVLKSTPKLGRAKGLQSEVLSPLALSPMQLLLSSPMLYSPHGDGIVPVSRSNNKSPTESLKTPHDTSSTKTEGKAPRLLRKSVLQENAINTNPDEFLNSAMNLDNTICSPIKHHDVSLNKSKVRTALFLDNDEGISEQDEADHDHDADSNTENSGELDISFSVKSFYPKDHSIEHSSFERRFNSALHKHRKIAPKQVPLYLCNRRKIVRRAGGQINAGVRHGIKKPKIKKAIELKISTALKTLRKTDVSNKENTPVHDESRKSTKDNQAINHHRMEAMSDLLRDFSCRQIKPLNPSVEQETFEVSILSASHPHRQDVVEPGKRFFKNMRDERAIITINDSVRIEMQENGKFKRLLDNDDTIAGPLSKRPKIITNAEVVPVPFGCDVHLVRDDSIVDVGAIIKRLETSPEMERQPLKTAAELLAAQGEILLSPTSLMCDMTSGLALSSPKRAKLNVTNVLNAMDSNVGSPKEKQPHAKLFPIFQGKETLQSRAMGMTLRRKDFVKSAAITSAMTTTKRTRAGLDPKQMYLDAGQKRIGLTKCSECQFVFHQSDANEEQLHENHHNASTILRFNGWKNEYVVYQTLDSRMIRISGQDSKMWWKKVKDVMSVVNRELGYYDLDMDLSRALVYFYIKQRTVIGCIVAEPKRTGYRLLANDGTTGNVELCAEQPENVRCGITRVWVAQSHRRQGIATTMMDSVRKHFMYGTVLGLNDVAMSAPTANGKCFGSRYFNTDQFLIFT